MKQTVVILILTLGFCAQAQTDFYTNVTNLWHQGYKSNVLAIANVRLNANSNDIAGLILKAEYDLEFLELSTISNSFQRVVQVGDTIETEYFVKRFELERQEYLDFLDLFKNEPIPANELLAERAKATINHKDMPTGPIEALQKDGYFD
jgi:hypothetical protein